MLFLEMQLCCLPVQAQVLSIHQQLDSYLKQLDVDQLSQMGVVAEDGTISKDQGLALIDKLKTMTDGRG